MYPPGTGLGQRVTTIAGLGKRVGTEAQADAKGNDLVDRFLVIPVVEVVDQLRALVTDEPAVLEL